MCSTKCKQVKCITKYYYYSYILGTYHSCDKLKIKKHGFFKTVVPTIIEYGTENMDKVFFL